MLTFPLYLYSYHLHTIKQISLSHIRTPKDLSTSEVFLLYSPDFSPPIMLCIFTLNNFQSILYLYIHTHIYKVPSYPFKKHFQAALSTVLTDHVHLASVRLVAPVAIKTTAISNYGFPTCHYCNLNPLPLFCLPV